jgi:hypothetical protein
MSSTDEARQIFWLSAARRGHDSIDTSQITRLDTILPGTDKVKATHISTLNEVGLHD